MTDTRIAEITARLDQMSGADVIAVSARTYIDDVAFLFSQLAAVTAERDDLQRQYTQCMEQLYDATAELAALKEAQRNRPEIVCLCGSTRFFKAFDEQNFRLTLMGKIVLSIGCNTKSDEGLCLTAADKERLDELHKRKIDLSDRILVLDVGGYIGDSTRSEIEYAYAHDKPVEYLEPLPTPPDHIGEGNKMMDVQEGEAK